MEQSQIFIPFLGTILLTACVWVTMVAGRVYFMTVNKLDGQSVATPQRLNNVLGDDLNNVTNNFINLFETPVLFYALCIYLFVTGQVDQLHLYLAYGFLFFRIVHSIIHCTVNIVAMRFTVYIISTLFLWAITARCLIDFPFNA